MPCCAKPTSKIIKIGDVDVGIRGLEESFRDVYASRIEDETILKDTLLSKIREHGNFVTPKREEIYKEALYQEHKNFYAPVQQTPEARKEMQMADKKQKRFSMKKKN